MPRPRRQIVPGLIYHVLNRGNGRRDLFRKPADFQAFLEILAEGLNKFPVDLLCWCLMSNHWHLVLRPRKADALQRLMQWVTLTHVRRHHRHHANEAGGHLYQGRYKHFCVQSDEAYFLTLCRYVESNPLRARLVRRAQDWPWSSLRQRTSQPTHAARATHATHATHAAPAARTTQQAWPPLADWPLRRPADWLRLVNSAAPAQELERVRSSMLRDRPLGSPTWVRHMAKKLGVTQTLRPRGRPRRSLESLSPRQRRRRETADSGHKGT